jgi:hypothetical protein
MGRYEHPPAPQWQQLWQQAVDLLERLEQYLDAALAAAEAPMRGCTRLPQAPPPEDSEDRAGGT